MSILDELKGEIRQSGMSMAEVARRSGIAMSGLSRLMSGERPSIRVDTAQALAEAIGMELRLIRRTRRGKRAGHGTSKVKA